jgi:hypothetical protein
MSGLKRRHRRLTRQVAREAIIACEGDLEAAKNHFNSHPLVYQIDASLVVLMLQIAIQLWQLWKSMNISEPSVVASSDELALLGESFYDEADDE